MADEGPLPSYWSDIFLVGKRITVSFLPASYSRFCSKRFHQYCMSQFCHWRSNWVFLILASRGIYDICLGLHPYVQHGGWFSLEIEVEFHERAVPLPTLPPIYRFDPYSLLSVRFFSYLLTLNSFYASHARRDSEFDQEWLSEVTPQQWRFVISHLDVKQRGLHFLPALTVLGLAASESKFSPPSLVSGCVNWQLPVILTLRTWAVWNRNRRLAIILLVLFTLIEGSSFVAISIYSNSVKCR